MSRSIQFALAALFACCLAVDAGEWKPSGPVNNIAPFTAGGGTDLLARAAQKYINLDGQSMVVTNIVGANGVIGAMEVHNSRPDGRTILCHNITSLVVSYINKTMTVDPMSFEPLGSLLYDSSVIYVAADSPFKTVDDIIAAAKARPGELKWASTALHGTNHLSSALFWDRAGISVNYVPFSGGSQHRAAVMGHHVDVGYGQISEVYPNIVSGEIRAVAALANKRLNKLPDVPTLKEAGFDLIDGGLRGHFAAPKTPPHVVEYLARRFKEVTEKPEFVKFVEQDLGAEVLFMTPQEIRDLGKRQYEERVKIYDVLTRQ